MRKSFILAVLVSIALLLLSACSPRDFLTRRLAADLIADSEPFRTAQEFQLRTGVVSNDDSRSSEYLVLQHRGWISATKAVCPPAMVPPPCWQMTLTPAGVDTIQNLVGPGDVEKPSFNIPAAKRELVAVSGISKQGNVADVEFTWKWSPLNEIGSVIYPADFTYRSIASFRRYDDGWRVVSGTTLHGQPLDDALKDAEPQQ
ncbi:MAG: hypothetical protein WB919_05240 [Candidatus Sulfotelmatobacter sp.]